MKNVATKTTGSVYTADDYENGSQQELENAVTTSGQSLTSSDQNQLGKSLAGYAAVSSFYTDSGAANAYVLSPIGSFQSPYAYTEGMLIRFRPSANNTGASTVNVNSLGVVNIKLADGTSDPSSGDITTTQDLSLRYDGTNFRFVQSTASLPRTYISGLILSNSAGDADHDIDIAEGQARSEDNTTNGTRSSTITKQIDATWASGTSSGGLASGVSLTTDTWYHVHLLIDNDGGTDVGFDTSPTAVNLLADASVIAAGYTKYRRIGSVLTDGSANILGFKQKGDQFWFDAKIQNTTTLPAGLTNETISTPTGVEVEAIINIEATENSGQGEINLKSNVVGDEYKIGFYINLTNAAEFKVTRIWADTSSQIQHGYTNASPPTTYELNTLAYIDPRGKE